MLRKCEVIISAKKSSKRKTPRSPSAAITKGIRNQLSNDRNIINSNQNYTTSPKKASPSLSIQVVLVENENHASLAEQGILWFFAPSVKSLKRANVLRTRSERCFQMVEHLLRTTNNTTDEMKSQILCDIQRIRAITLYEKVREHQWSRWQQSSIHKKSNKEMKRMQGAKKVDNEKDEEGDVVMGDTVIGDVVMGEDDVVATEDSCTPSSNASSLNVLLQALSAFEKYNTVANVNPLSMSDDNYRYKQHGDPLVPLFLAKINMKLFIENGGVQGINKNKADEAAKNAKNKKNNNSSSSSSSFSSSSSLSSLSYVKAALEILDNASRSVDGKARQHIEYRLQASRIKVLLSIPIPLYNSESSSSSIENVEVKKKWMLNYDTVLKLLEEYNDEIYWTNKIETCTSNATSHGSPFTFTAVPTTEGNKTTTTTTNESINSSSNNNAIDTSNNSSSSSSSSSNVVNASRTGAAAVQAMLATKKTDLSKLQFGTFKIQKLKM